MSAANLSSRSWQDRLIPHWRLLILCLFPILVVWPLLIGNAPGSFGAIASMAPWNKPASPEAWDILSADGALQFYVWRDVVFESWRTGQIPVWNPYQLMGTPLLANSQSAPLYPLHVLVAYLPLPTATVIGLLAWVHLAVAGVGVSRLAKALGAHPTGAMLAGLAFSTSVFMVAWIPLASVITTVAWVPLAMAFGVETLQGKSKLSVVWFAASVGMILLGGHLQLAVYGLIGVVLALIGGSFVARPKIGAIALAVMGLAVGVALSTAQTFPSYLNGQTSHRLAKATPEGWEAYQKSAVQPFEFAALTLPNGVGIPHRMEPDSQEFALPQYWPGLVKRGAHLAESAISVSPLIFLLAGMLVVAGNRRRLITPALVALIGIGIAMGPVSNLLYFYFPGWSATGSPGRASFLWVLGLCLLGAFGWSATGERKIKSLSLIPVGLALIVSILLTQSAPGLTAWVGQQVFPTIASRRLLDLLPAAGVCFVLCAGIVYYWQKVPRTVLVAMAVALQAYVAIQTTYPYGEVPYQKQKFDPFTRRAFVNKNWDMLGRPAALMPPNTATAERQHDVAGYDSILHRDVVEMLREANGTDPAPPTNGNIMHIKPGFDAGRLAALGVSEVVSKDPIPTLGEGVVDSAGLHHYGLNGQRFSMTGGTVLTAVDRWDGLDLTVDGEGELTVRDRNVPGWIATVDGKRVPIQEGKFRTIRINGRGAHSVKFRYEPPGLGLGLMVSACALVLLIAVGIATTMSEKKEDSEVES